MQKTVLLKRLSLIALAIVSLYAAVSVVHDAVFEISAPWLTAPNIVAYSREYITQMDPIDMGFLVPGIKSKPTFLSTFGWWHETWAGTVPFWRPLTSQFFWLEYHFFGFDHLDKWQWVGIASHFVAVLLLALLALRLFENKWIAPVAVLFFAGSEKLWPADLLAPLYGVRQIPANIALDSWKNQPELWTAACTFGAILAAISGRWAAAMACTAAAICFKESGWYLYLIVPLALWGVGKLGQVPRRVVIATIAMAVVFILLRASAGWTVFYGYHTGPETSGLTRYFTAVEGFWVGLLRSPSAATAIMAGCLFALMILRRPGEIARLILAAVVILACIFLNARLQLTTPDAAVAQYMEWDLELGNLVLSLLWLGAAWVLLTSPTYRRMGLAVVGMVLVSGISMGAAVQITRHVLYPTYAFQSLLMAMVLAACAERAAGLWKDRQANGSRSHTEATPSRAVAAEATGSRSG